VTKTTTYPISDDHTSLMEAGIPSFLVIDFDYEPWFNTTGDTLDKCDPQSLEAVGRTLTRYLTLP
jgi:Zn-dependent M28 family amino/carboxypeptidase